MAAARTSGPATELVARLREASAKPLDVARFLDGLAPAERLQAIRGVGRRDQRRLYQLVDGFRELRLVDLVPPAVPALATVCHHGRNTLPLFTQFEKRFCRPHGADPEHPDRLYGHNFQWTSFVTGPGYFVARPHPSRPELLIDYRELPGDCPPGWPEIRSNERGFGRLVYGFMVDTLRGVSEHVTIGSAARNGRDLGSWFLLCREDPSPR